MAKLYSSRLEATDDTLLIRIPETGGASKLLRVVKDESGNTQTVKGKPAPTCRGIVVDVGPGEYQNGVLVPVDPRIKPGVTILFDPSAKVQLDIEEWREERLWVMSAKAVLVIEKPA